MSRTSLIVLLLGLLFVAAPFSRQFGATASDEYADGYDDEEEEDAGGEDHAEDPDTVVLSEKNFDEIVGGSQFALVEFYAPWCGHCKSLAPHWATTSTTLKDYEPKVIIGKVDATKNNELAQKFSVQGFPTIKWFVDGEVVGDYNGGRTSDDIIQWVKKKTGPVVSTVETPEALAELEKQSDVVFFGLFAALEGPEYEAYNSVAKKIDGVIFAQSTDPKVAEAAGLAQPGVAAIKNFLGEGRDVSAYSGAADAEDAVKEWVEAEKVPLTIEFNEASAQKIFNSGISFQLIFWSKAADFAPDAPEFKALREAAKELKGQLIFVTSNKDDEASQPITNYFKLEGAETPVVLGFQLQGNKKFKYNGQFTKEDLVAFATSVLDGTAPGDYKSAAVPEEPTDEGVSVVVGTTFDHIVLDSSKDVFLEVYAPWCGHCKSLAPIWSRLAAHYAAVDSVVIAKMDGTENDHPSIEVQGYPMLRFFPASIGGEVPAPVPYEGDRDFESLVAFIQQHAKVPFEPPAVVEPEEEEEEQDGAKEEL